MKDVILAYLRERQTDVWRVSKKMSVQLEDLIKKHANEKWIFKPIHTILKTDFLSHSLFWYLVYDRLDTHNENSHMLNAAWNVITMGDKSNKLDEQLKPE